MDNILELINDNNFEKIIKIKDFNKIKINDNNIIHLLAIRGNELGLDFFINYKENKDFDINIANDSGFNILHLLFNNGWDKLAEKYYEQFPELLYNIDNNICAPLVYCIDRFETFLKCFTFMERYKKSEIQNILNNVSITNYNIIILLIKKSKNKEDDPYKQFLFDIIDLIDFEKPKSSPVLIYSILNNKTILAKYFIKNEKGIENKNLLYILPLNVACGKNNIEIVKMILEINPNIEYGGLDNDYLPLNIAINNDFLELTELLTPYIKNYNMIDKYKNTPLHYLADKVISYHKKKQTEFEDKAKSMLRIFVKNTNIDYPNNQGVTARKLLEKYLHIRKVVKDSETKNLSTEINSIEEEDYNSIESNSDIDIDIIKSKKKYNNGLFNTDVYHNMLYSLYLLNKYDNLAIPFQKYNDKKYNIDNEDLIMQNISYDKYYQIIYDIISIATRYLYPLVPSLIIWKNRDLHYINDELFKIIEEISKDKKKRFIMIKITLIVGVKFTHANIILIDMKDNTVRRFEPYGISDVNDESYLDKLLNDKISKALDRKIKYYRPNDYLNISKFQSVSNDSIADFKKTGDPGGYCLGWCFWYVELKINNPDISEEELILNASKKISNNYKSSINPYLSFIRDYGRKLNGEKDKILKQIKIKNSEFYDITYKINNLEKVLKYFNNYFSKL